MEQPKFHVRIYYIEGLEMGKAHFVWNDKLIIKDAGTQEGNIAEAHIFIDRPIPEFGDEHTSEREEMLIISVFLACVGLINTNLDLRLDRTDTSMYSIYHIEDFKSQIVSTFSGSVYDLPAHPRRCPIQNYHLNHFEF